MISYDSCVVNKLISRVQCVIFRHMDDSKCSHKDEKFISEILETIKDILEIDIHGDENDLLGVYSKTSKKNKIVEISMSD